MKKVTMMVAVLALAAAFAPQALACGKHAAQASADGKDMKGSGCSMKGMKGESSKDGCIMKTAACLEKMTATDKDGNLACAATGTVYAKAVQEGGKTVYQVGDKTYRCKFEAASASFALHSPDKPNHLDKANLSYDKDGNLICPCCDMTLAQARKGADGAVTYAVGGTDYDCAFEALLAAKGACEKRCGGKDLKKASGEKHEKRMKSCGART